MRYRKLDANGDYSFGGQLDYFRDTPQAVAQAVQTRLTLFRGEWFLDTTDGTPWLEEVLGNGTRTTYDAAIRQRILGTPGVTELVIAQYIADKSGLDVLDNGDSAALQVSFVAALAASPAFTGVPTAPTPGAADNSTKLATTAFVRGILVSPNFTGVPTAPTAAAGTNTTQLATTAFAQSAVSQALPAGAVMLFAMNTAPATWLKASGAAVSVATYAALATNIYCGDSLNATALFGFRCTDPANPSTTRSTTGGYIVLPDLRGEFPRAWDDSRGVDSGRAFGSAQGAAVDSAGVQLRQASTTWAATGVGIGAAVGYLSNSAISSYGSNMAVFGGTETRPRNVALLACIKF